MTTKKSTTKKPPAPKKTRKTAKPKADSAELKPEATPEIQDPIGDETDGEGKTALESQAGTEAESEIEAASDAQTEVDAEVKAEDGGESRDADEGEESEPTFTPKPRPPANLERLQKILAKAGVASRRKAEEMIEQGRVQVNGKVITELGTKADAGRDHIRVDGKLLQGAERQRYFVLNKPRGFVTTVKDPEGRPTVMQFFDKMRERLYPVGRLDYLSEGLLLVTNDGELANRLTRAAAGVEKTYLVKVAGQPTEAELDILRGGVAIERGKPGSDRVRTSPARIRQVRQGDNPWYEVVLIEGRNRELRKMFEEIGHFVEKIRRVGYGPLILDQEPGNLRELDAQELMLLRKAADGTLRTPKSKEIRRRNLIDSLPAEKPAFRPKPPRSAEGSKDYRPKRAFESRSGEGRPRESRVGREPRTGEQRSGGFRGGTAGATRTDRPGDDNLRSIRPAGRDFGPSRPAWKKDARPAAGGSFRDKPPARKPYAGKPASEQRFAPKPAGARPFGDRPAAGKTYGGKPAFGKSAPGRPSWPRPGGSDRPPFKRPVAPRHESAPARDEDFGPVRPPNLHIEEIHGASRPTSSGPGAARPYSPRPNAGRPGSSRPGFDRPRFDRPSRPGAPGSDAPYSRPASGRSGFGPDRSGSGPGRSSAGKPFRSQGGLARPFTTSSGKPRPGGARPSRKPGGADRSSSGGWKSGKPVGSSRSAPAAGSGPRPAGKTGWKPRPSFGPGKPPSGNHSKPKPGGFSKSGYKGKPSGSGPRSFGKRSGGPSGGGKKRD